MTYFQDGSFADISGFGVVIEPVSGALKHPTELQTARYLVVFGCDFVLSNLLASVLANVQANIV